TPGDDRGVLLVEPYVRAVKRNFDTLVAVQLHPPETDDWIDRTYAMGVDAVSYNLELNDVDALRRHCPGRVGRIGRERYEQALRHAAAIFPSGTVWSDLVVGLEPSESTVAGIDALVSFGVLPVLSLPRAAAATSGDLSSISAHLFKAVRDAKISMGWVR